MLVPCRDAPLASWRAAAGARKGYEDATCDGGWAGPGRQRAGLGWCQQGGDEAAKPATGAATAAATAATTAAATAAATASAPAAATAEVLPAGKLPEGRSAAPKLEEWNTLKKEVTVK